MDKLQLCDYDISTRSAPSIPHFQKGEIKEAQLIIHEEIEHFKLENCTDFPILFPGQDKFNMSRFDIYNYDMICTPTLILQPKTKEDVSACIKGYKAGMKRCQKQKKIKIPRLCIKGGGNSMNAMKDGAVVLDLSSMRNVKVNNNYVYCEGGALVQDLDYACGKYGLLGVSGTCPTLGVVGCLLSGGIGYASRKYGLSCDNLLSAEIVLANGFIVTCTSNKNSDLFYALKGGGGGFGVVVSVTLRCYPCKNAALLSFGLYAPVSKKKVLRRWANWVYNQNNALGHEDTCYLLPECYQRPLPNEVFAQLILPTNSSTLSFSATSIDTAKLSQIETNSTDFFDASYKSPKQNMQHHLNYIPGFELFKKHKFGALFTTNPNLRILRYCELSSMNQAMPGNVFLAYKYAEYLNEEVMDVLMDATSNKNKWCPKNESRVIIASGGGVINAKSKSPIQRPINYFITIEGRWNDTPNTSKFDKKKESVKKWVHLLANQLSHCKGIHSTSHPEALREVVSKSGRSDPPIGWYNFDKEGGERLEEIKRMRDGKGVFSLARGRVSWMEDGTVGSDSSLGVCKSQDDSSTNEDKFDCGHRCLDDCKSI